jgi:glycosyltransferase involved in cell wall biosynthesis
VDVPQDRSAAEVSVLVSTRDRPHLLDRCLRAVLAGSVLPGELLVVDQSRGDASRRVVEELTAEGHLQVRWVRHHGSGLSRSQNLGFASARGQLVLVTDDDCVPAPDWVEAAARSFAQDASLGLLGGRVLALGDDEPGRFPVSTRTSTVPVELDATTMPWDVGSGNNFGVRLSALRAIGGNDVRLGPGAPLLGGADMDLFRRLLCSGAGGRYEPSVLVHHERADASERLGRRVPYGYGMGACLALWWRQGDPLARKVLTAWLWMRLHRLAGGARTRDGMRVREELLVLSGTARGLVRGVRVPAEPETGT